MVQESGLVQKVRGPNAAGIYHKLHTISYSDYYLCPSRLYDTPFVKSQCYEVQSTKSVTEPWNSRLAIDKSVNSHVNLYLFKYENVCFLFDFFSVISKMTGIPFGTKLLFAPWKVLN